VYKPIASLDIVAANDHRLGLNGNAVTRVPREPRPAICVPKTALSKDLRTSFQKEFLPPNNNGVQFPRSEGPHITVLKARNVYPTASKMGASWVIDPNQGRVNDVVVYDIDGIKYPDTVIAEIKSIIENRLNIQSQQLAEHQKNVESPKVFPKDAAAPIYDETKHRWHVDLSGKDLSVNYTLGTERYHPYQTQSFQTIYYLFSRLETIMSYQNVDSYDTSTFKRALVSLGWADAAETIDSSGIGVARVFVFTKTMENMLTLLVAEMQKLLTKKTDSSPKLVIQKLGDLCAPSEYKAMLLSYRDGVFHVSCPYPRTPFMLEGEGYSFFGKSVPYDGAGHIYTMFDVNPPLQFKDKVKKAIDRLGWNTLLESLWQKFGEKNFYCMNVTWAALKDRFHKEMLRDELQTPAPSIQSVPSTGTVTAQDIRRYFGWSAPLLPQEVVSGNE